MRHLRSRAAIAALAACAAPAFAEQPIPASAKPVPDPAVRHGRLPNGLRYAVMRNANTAGGVSIRLGMDIGSYDEADAERGAAHFVEHMAFRSPRTFPDGSIEQAFSRHGISWGRDQNAATMLDRTLYWIDVPERGRSQVGTALQWLRDVADGIGFGEAAVAVERGVVQSEKRTRNNPLTALQEEIGLFQAPGLRSVTRDPIGTDDTLRSLSAKQLKSFYDRWYRPENGLVVMVGDLPAEEMEQRLKTTFASWTGRGPAGVRATPAPPPSAGRKTEALVRSSPAYPNMISSCRAAAPDSKDDEHFRRARRELHDLIWPAILNERLNGLVTGGKSSLLGATMVFNGANPDAKLACLVILPIGDAWQPALAAAQAELRRFGADGPTDGEVDRAIEGLRSKLRGGVSQAAARTSAEIAQAITDLTLSKGIFSHPRVVMRDFDIAADGIGPVDVKAAFAADWTGSEPQLVALAPTAPEGGKLIAAWHANQQAPGLAAYADRSAVAWAYRDLGTRGKVVRREPVDRYGFVRHYFDNGVVLNLKKTDFGGEASHVAVAFGRGRQEIAGRDLGVAIMGAEMLAEGGLGKMSIEEIRSIFTDEGWKFSLGIGNDTFQLSARTIASSVPAELSLLAAFMSDPGFRSEIDARMPSAVDLAFRLKASDPMTAALEAAERTLFPGAATLPEREVVAAYRSADFARVLKPALTRSPIEVAVVGPVDEEEVLNAVAATFGALPKREAEPAEAEPGFKRFPAAMPPPVVAQHEGPADKAAVLLLWPLYVATPERRKEEYGLSVLSALFDQALRQRVRVSMGKSYAPVVGNAMPDHADQGMIMAAVETLPGDVDAVIAAARATAAALAAGEISGEALEAARQPLLAQRAEMLRNNGAWAEALAGSARDPQGLRDLTEFEAIVGGLTLAEVKEVAAKWLKAQPAVAKALPKASKAATGAAR